MGIKCVCILSKVCFMFGGLENLTLDPAAHKQNTHIQVKQCNLILWYHHSAHMYTFTASHKMHLP